jgi:hypothetical protein
VLLSNQIAIGYRTYRGFLRCRVEVRMRGRATFSLCLLSILVPGISNAQQTTTASVFSGNETRVLAPNWVNTDCTSGLRPDVRIVSPPSNGSIRLEDMQIAVSRNSNNSRAHCNGKQVDAVGVFYKSTENFVGTDKVVIEADFKTGVVHRYTAVIDVRTPGQAEAPADETIAASVLTGKETRVAAPHSVQADCTSGQRPEVRVATPPSSGSIRLAPIALVVNRDKSDARANCNGKQVDAVGVFYRSNAGFVGQDRAVIEWDTKTGSVRRSTVVVEVR